MARSRTGWTKHAVPRDAGAFTEPVNFKVDVKKESDLYAFATSQKSRS